MAEELPPEQARQQNKFIQVDDAPEGGVQSSEIMLAGAASMAFFAVLAYGFSLVLKRVRARVSILPKVVLCGVLAPIIFFVLGWYFVEPRQGFVDWLIARPARAHLIGMGWVAVGLLVSWLVLRDRRRQIDSRIFD